MGWVIRFDNGGDWYGTDRPELEEGARIWIGRTSYSAANGNSLLVVNNGTVLHFAHSVQWGFVPFGAYTRVPVEPEDLNALVSTIEAGGLEGDTLPMEDLIVVGRLGIMRTLTPPTYRLIEDRDVPYYVAVGYIRRDKQSFVGTPLAIWPEEWEAFRRGAHVFRCSVVPSRQLAAV